MQISRSVRIGALSLVAVLAAGLVWLGVGRYQAERGALQFATQAGAEAASGSSVAVPVPEANGIGPGAPAATGSAPSDEPKTKGATLTVHVTGAVAIPGVYHLEAGARIDDLIKAAGGAVPGGLPDSLNLAARLHDGDKVYVPTAAELRTADPAPAPAPLKAPPVAQGATKMPVQAESAASTPGANAGKVNVNTASASELAAVTGIGPSLAKAIIDYRAKHGPFKKFEELDGVSGIGPKTLEKLRPLLTV